MTKIVRLMLVFVLGALPLGCPDESGVKMCINNNTRECYSVNSCTTCNTAGPPWDCQNGQCPAGLTIDGTAIDLTPAGDGRWNTNYGFIVGSINTVDMSGMETRLDNSNVTVVHIEFSRIEPPQAVVDLMSGTTINLYPTGPSSFPLFEQWATDYGSVVVGSIVVTNNDGVTTRLDVSNTAAVQLEFSRLEPQAIEADMTVH